MPNAAPVSSSDPLASRLATRTPTTTELARRLAVARGDEPADTVVCGARVLNVFTREWLEADVAIVDGTIAGLGSYEGHELLDVSGGFLVPGFVDAHMHIESTKLLLDEFARLVLPLGTTTVVADPHEIANVLGSDGVHWLLDTAAELPLDVFFMASSSVPASVFESPRRELTLGDLEGLLRRQRVLGVAEMMNFPDLVAGSTRELAKLRLSRHVDGHAPGVSGKALNAYAAAGVESDHEAATLEEGRERLRAGMWLLIREASGARNLEALVPLAKEYGPHRFAFCTDDREPEHVADDGHINAIVRDAVALGLPVADALVMASFNAAAYHGLRELGAIAPGYQADLLVLDELSTFSPRSVLKRGRALGEIASVAVPGWTRRSVHISRIGAEELAVPWRGGRGRVIGLMPGQITTRLLLEELPSRDGFAVADVERDLAKIVVFERHLDTGRVGKGFVHGFGLRRGAFASTVAHDGHNLIVVGVEDEAMLVAARRLRELGGGLVVAESDGVRAELPLPVAGLLSDRPLAEVLSASREVAAAVATLGVGFPQPIQTLAFLSLSVIPSLKITDRGLVDVDRFELVELAV